MGYYAGQSGQGTNGIAIGVLAGNAVQGANSVSIGNFTNEDI
jgi:hypothetical protein